METGTISETFSNYLEFWTMRKVQKASGSEVHRNIIQMREDDIKMWSGLA
jgi:hypothetical protein